MIKKKLMTLSIYNFVREKYNYVKVLYPHLFNFFPHKTKNNQFNLHSYIISFNLLNKNFIFSGGLL